jgi:hypothetical protein
VARSREALRDLAACELAMRAAFDGEQLTAEQEAEVLAYLERLSQRPA